MKWSQLKTGFLFAVLWVAAGFPTAQASTTVTQVNAATELVVGSTRSFFYPLTGTCGSAGGPQYYPASGVTVLNQATLADGPLFDISSTSTRSDLLDGDTSGTLSVYVEKRTGTTATGIGMALVDVEGRTFNDGSAGNPSGQAYLNYPFENTDGGHVRFRIAFGQLGTSQGLCDQFTGLCPAPTSATTALSLRVGIVRTGARYTDATVVGEYEDIDLYFSQCPPGGASGAISAPAQVFTLVPGDGRVKLTTQTDEPSDLIRKIGVTVFAAPSSGAITTSAPIKKFFSQTTGTLTVDGLTNDTEYCFSLGYVNAARLMSTDADWSTSLTSGGCATPREIQGFLKDSTCFIATAAYGGDFGDARLNVLHRFRDEILNRHALGRAFVAWYYDWSPEAASWLVEHPAYATVVRAALYPVVETARASLWVKNQLWNGEPKK